MNDGILFDDENFLNSTKWAPRKFVRIDHDKALSTDRLTVKKEEDESRTETMY